MTERMRMFFNRTETHRTGLSVSYKFEIQHIMTRTQKIHHNEPLLLNECDPW